jgi:HD superfamily phosphodiesterase
MSSAKLDILKQLEIQEVAPRFDRWLEAVVTHRAVRPELWRGLRCAEQSSLHGRRHWTRVACLGLAMLRDEGARRPHEEQLVIERRFLLAAFFHDIGRLDEGRDTGHAERGEQVFRFIVLALCVDSADIESVALSIRNHASDPAVLPGADLVAACVANADRLDRARLCEHPLPGCMYPELPWEDWEEAAWEWATGQ